MVVDFTLPTAFLLKQSFKSMLKAIDSVNQQARETAHLCLSSVLTLYPFCPLAFETNFGIDFRMKLNVYLTAESFSPFFQSQSTIV